MIHYMLLLGYILVTCHKNNTVTLHVTFMLYRRNNKTCLLGCDVGKKIKRHKVNAPVAGRLRNFCFSFELNSLINQ